MGFSVVALVVVACDNADSRTTAVVERIEKNRVCLAPTREENRDLQGCYPFRSQDRAKLASGACISVVIPNQLKSEKREDALRDIRELKDGC